MFTAIKNAFVTVWGWVTYAWGKFEEWVHMVAPGLKTLIASGLGAVSTFAATLQEYITGLPLDKFVSGTQIAILTTVLFTLAFWFHGMGDRVDARS